METVEIIVLMLPTSSEYLSVKTLQGEVFDSTAALFHAINTVEGWVGNILVADIDMVMGGLNINNLAGDYEYATVFVKHKNVFANK